MKTDTPSYVVEIGDEKHVGTVVGTRGTKVKVQWHTGLTKMYPKKNIRTPTPTELAAARCVWENIEFIAKNKEASK